MDKVSKPSSSGCHTPSLEHFRFYLLYCFTTIRDIYTYCDMMTFGTNFNKYFFKVQWLVDHLVLKSTLIVCCEGTDAIRNRQIFRFSLKSVKYLFLMVMHVQSTCTE
jgi:hypothetical protein